MLSIKTKILKEKLYAGQCPYCEKLNTVIIYVSQDYTCFLGISYWPLKKAAHSCCTHCKQVLAKKEMPFAIQQQAEAMLKSAKTPLLSYGGLIFIAACFGYGLYAAYSKDVKTEQLVLAPQVGDIYYTNYNTDEYGLMKVINVKSDSVYFYLSNYTSDGESGLEKILKKENAFGANETAYSRKDLQDDAKRNRIINIKREK